MCSPEFTCRTSAALEGLHQITIDQPDLFGGTTPSTSPLGLLVVLPLACECGAHEAVIGSSRACHHAKLTCARCGRFATWLSPSALAGINEQIDYIGGRPAAPIILRKNGK
jgi:hypothetical protein